MHAAARVLRAVAGDAAAVHNKCTGIFNAAAGFPRLVGDPAGISRTIGNGEGHAFVYSNGIIFTVAFIGLADDILAVKADHHAVCRLICTGDLNIVF